MCESCVKSGYDGSKSLYPKYDCFGAKRDPLLVVISQPDKLFQMTATSRHPINGAGLKKALAALRNGDSARLYFVVPPRVPPKIFNEFPKQTIKRSESDPDVLVAQYVIKLDI